MRSVLHFSKTFNHRAYKFGSRSAASAGNFHSVLNKICHTVRKFLGRNVVLVGYRVGKPGVRLNGKGQGSPFGKFGNHRFKLFRTERTVYSYSVNAQSLHSQSHCGYRTARKCPHIFLKCHGCYYRKIAVFLCGKHRRFQFVKVGHGLTGNNVSACVYGGGNFLLENVVGFLKGKASGRLQKLSYGTYVKGYQRLFAASFFCYSDSCWYYFRNGFSCSSHFITVAAECVCTDYLRPCGNVSGMNIVYPVWLIKVEHFGYAAHFHALCLEHCAHCSVPKDELVIF